MGLSTSRPAGRAIACLALIVGASLALAGCGGAFSGARSAATTGGAAPVQATAPPMDTGVADSSAELAAGAPSGGSGEGVTSPAPVGSDIAKSGQTKLVIVNKTLRLETEDVKKALDSIRSLAKKAGGDIANMQVSTSTDQPVYRPAATDGSADAGSSGGNPLQAWVTVRVPAATYGAFVEEASKLGKVQYQAESTQDVTQQHVDMKARLDNLNAELVRLRQLFAKARTVTEMLQVERELARVQGEVESLKAQIEYLERQAAMATVTIELTEPKPIVRPSGIDWGVGSAVTESVRAFVGTLNVLIVLLGPVLALLVFVGLPLFLIVRAVVRRSRRRSASAASRTAASQEPVDLPTDGNETA